MRITCFLFLILCGCSSQDDSKAPASGIPITAQTPKVQDVTEYVESIGTLKAKAMLEIVPKTYGTLAAVFVKEGQWVETDTPLFQIDPVPYTIKVKEAEALQMI